MNEDYRAEYEASLRNYINARAKLDSFLRDAQAVTEDTANYILTEGEDFRSIEESAREDWNAARDAYLQ